MSAETSHATPARAEDKTPPKGLGAMAGAMFLMATSAIGPGFFDPDLGLYRADGGFFRVCDYAVHPR